MASERLYHDDSYLRSFAATVMAVAEDGGIELDRSAFYPESGGQAHDLGTLNGLAVTRVTESAGRVLHFVAGEIPPGSAVQGEIDWPRRFDLMQHHTGQHLLSAVAEDRFGWKTVSVHMSPESATVELAAASIGEDALALLEEEANRAIQRNLPVRVAVHGTAEGLALRKATDRQGEVRVVSIGELDHSACGGTHVRATGEIGCLSLGRVEKIRSNMRVEFLCGMRAVSAARQRARWLSEAAGVFQTSPDRIAALAVAQREEALSLAKQCRALQLREAQRDGEEARQRLGGGHAGVIVAVRQVAEAIGERERAFAQAFCEALPEAGSGESPQTVVLLTLARATGAFLLCATPGGSFDAKAWLAEIGNRYGVKGGGTAAMANGRVPDFALLPKLIEALPASPVEIEASTET